MLCHGSTAEMVELVTWVNLLKQNYNDYQHHTLPQGSLVAAALERHGRLSCSKPDQTLRKTNSGKPSRCHISIIIRSNARVGPVKWNWGYLLCSSAAVTFSHVIQLFHDTEATLTLSHRSSNAQM
jgi:hypothetical protein